VFAAAPRLVLSATAPMGSGLRNMADRLAALRGQLEIRSAPSCGTIITGHLPVPVTSSGMSAQPSHPAEATTA
jgi:signal transduction histidine kinase